MRKHSRVVDFVILMVCGTIMTSCSSALEPSTDPIADKYEYALSQMLID